MVNNKNVIEPLNNSFRRVALITSIIIILAFIIGEVLYMFTNNKVLGHELIIITKPNVFMIFLASLNILFFIRSRRKVSKLADIAYILMFVVETIILINNLRDIFII